MPGIRFWTRLANIVGMYPGWLGTYFLCLVVLPPGGVEVGCVALFCNWRACIMQLSRKLMSILVKIDPLKVVSVSDVTVFVVVGSFTFPLVLCVVCVWVVPFVWKVDIKLVDSISLLLWLLPNCVIASFGRSTISFLGQNEILIGLEYALHLFICFGHNTSLCWIPPCIFWSVYGRISKKFIDFWNIDHPLPKSFDVDTKSCHYIVCILASAWMEPENILWFYKHFVDWME